MKIRASQHTLLTFYLLTLLITVSGHSIGEPRRYIIIQGNSETGLAYSVGSFMVDYEHMHTLTSLFIPGEVISIVSGLNEDRSVYYHIFTPHEWFNHVYQDEPQVPVSLLVRALRNELGQNFDLITSPVGATNTRYHVDSYNLDILRATIHYDTQSRLSEIDGARLYFRADLPAENVSLNYDLCNEGFYFRLGHSSNPPPSTNLQLTTSSLARVLQLGLIALTLADLTSNSLTDFEPTWGPDIRANSNYIPEPSNDTYPFPDPERELEPVRTYEGPAWGDIEINANPSW